jgi:hypothetical protein
LVAYLHASDAHIALPIQWHVMHFFAIMVYVQNYYYDTDPFPPLREAARDPIGHDDITDSEEVRLMKQRERRARYCRSQCTWGDDDTKPRPSVPLWKAIGLFALYLAIYACLCVFWWWIFEISWDDNYWVCYLFGMVISSLGMIACYVPQIILNYKVSLSHPRRAIILNERTN